MDINVVKRQLELINQRLVSSNTEAKEFFEQSRSKLDNPLSVEEELSYQREIFSKLKFQYLEQETRDKFLREISESQVRDITHEDVEEASLESIEKKQRLKTLKSHLQDKIGQLERTTENKIAIQKELENTYKTTKDILDESIHMQQEIDRIINSHSGVTQELIRSMNLAEEDDTNSVIARNRTVLSKEGTTLINIEKDIQAKQQTIDSEQRDISTLEQDLQKLNAAISNINPHDKPSKSQLFAKWCKEINELLLKFSPASNLELYKSKNADRFTLSLTLFGSSFEFLFDKEFNLLNVKDTNGNSLYPPKGPEPIDGTSVSLSPDKELMLVIESLRQIEQNTTRIVF